MKTLILRLALALAHPLPNRVSVFSLIFMGLMAGATTTAQAQEYRFLRVEVIGNIRIETATILSYVAIPRDEVVTAGQVNAAQQRLVESGLFETVLLEPQGQTLVIRVAELPTVNEVNIEGNQRLKDEDLAPLLRTQSRRIYNPNTVEEDADLIAQAYEQAGRVAAVVTPRIIRRSDNRVDVIFEVIEGRVTEIERISFVGNRSYSERRLRRALETTQAGILRTFIRTDTYIEDRIELDKQLLSDFYMARGYVDFRVLSVTSELSRSRDGLFVTFNVQEGQQFSYGEITASSDLPEVDMQEFQDAIRIRSGQTYSPVSVENTIARLERLAVQAGLDFVRVDPRVTRNDRDLTLDIEFAIVRGPRIFVERIEIEGNTTTLDRVIRNQFDVVEGDPFNPRAIREAARRIEFLQFFSATEVSAREGSSPDQVIVDVEVQEQPTGSLSFGASYNVNTGVGVTASLSERNFLGRGQALSFSIEATDTSQAGSIGFTEPNLLGRDLSLNLFLNYSLTTEDADTNANYKSSVAQFTPSLTFPVSENGELRVLYNLYGSDLYDVSADSSQILRDEEARGIQIQSGIGYQYSYDTRGTGLNPDAGVVLRFGQNISGLGGDLNILETNALIGGETTVFSGDVTLRAVAEAGALYNISGGGTRITDRYRLPSSQLRGFEPNGIGPRDLAVANEDALGGNYYFASRLEAEFPLGLPDEYGISGGVFLDAGSLWGLDNTAGGPAGADPVDDDFYLRSVIGFSIFWDTAIGPLRFNFSRALDKQSYDRVQNFDLTISTSF